MIALNDKVFKIYEQRNYCVNIENNINILNKIYLFIFMNNII